MALGIRYRETCAHCTSPAIGYLKRLTKTKGDDSLTTWLCSVHAQVYPLDQVVVTDLSLLRASKRP